MCIDSTVAGVVAQVRVSKLYDGKIDVTQKTEEEEALAAELVKVAPLLTRPCSSNGCWGTAI